MNNRLLSRKGESISEALVSLLIASLAMLMFVGAVTASTHLIMSAKERMNTYYAERNHLEETMQKNAAGEGSEETAITFHATASDDVPVTIKINDYSTENWTAYRKK